MARRSAPGIAFRITITVYAAGLVTWLLLGLLPPLAEHVAAVHHLLASTAEHHSAFGRLATRVLHPDTMADTTTWTQTVIQYSFSVLNLLMGLLLVVRRPDETVPRLLGFALLGTAATFNLPSHRAFHITGDPWPIAAIHFTFHIVSGVSYIWAVVLFPDGRLPRRLRIGRRTTASAVPLRSPPSPHSCAGAAASWPTHNSSSSSSVSPFPGPASIASAVAIARPAVDHDRAADRPPAVRRAAAGVRRRVALGRRPAWSRPRSVAAAVPPPRASPTTRQPGSPWSSPWYRSCCSRVSCVTGSGTSTGG